MRSFVLSLAGLIVFSISNLGAVDWPCWRGKDGLGVSPEKGLPTHWSKTDHIVWSTSIPGRGASSPVVVGERVFVTTLAEDTGLHVLALDR